MNKENLIKALTGLLNQLNKTKFGLIILLFASFTLWLFREPIGTWLIKDQQAPTIEKVVNRDILIYGVLNDMLAEFNAGRAYIYTFHNGQNYLAKDAALRHKQRSSMDYEVTAPGVKEIALQMQNIPVSLFAIQINNILNEQVLGIGREKVQDMAAKTMMEQIGSTHAAVLSYRDDQGNVIMMVGVDWVMQNDIFFPEERFRRYVQNIGDLFLGYTDRATMWNLRDNTTRGRSEASVEKELKPVIVVSEHAHYLAGTKALPKRIVR